MSVWFIPLPSLLPFSSHQYSNYICRSQLSEQHFPSFQCCRQLKAVSQTHSVLEGTSVCTKHRVLNIVLFCFSYIWLVLFIPFILHQCPRLPQPCVSYLLVPSLSFLVVLHVLHVLHVTSRLTCWMQIIPRPEWSVSQEHLAQFPTVFFAPKFWTSNNDWGVFSQ